MSSSLSRFSGWRSRSLSLGEGLTDSTGARDGTRADGVLDRGRRRKQQRETRRLLTNRPCSSLSTKSHGSNERLRVSNWIMQRLNYYAVKKTVEFRLLTVFQHVADPARVCTVADKNSAVTPLDLRPTVADQVFEGNSIEVRGQFDRTMNMPSTC